MYDVILRVWLLLQTGAWYTVFVARQTYQRGIFVLGLKFSFHHHQVWYNKLVRQKQLRKRCSSFYFRVVITSGYIQVRISLSRTSTRSNLRQMSAMKSQANVSHDISNIRLYTQPWALEGRRYLGALASPCILKFDIFLLNFQQKGCLLSFE